MARDTKEELQRLEQELLAAESDKTVDELLADEELKDILEDKPKARKTDRTTKPSKEPKKEPKKEKSLTGLIIAVLLLSAAVVGMLCFMMVRYLGAI